MGGAKRQETTSLRSSSSRRDSVSPAASTTCNNHVKTVDVGCMAGIFHFVSKYHTRRKFLTFGKKQEKQVLSTPKPENTITCKSHDHQTIFSSPSRLSLEVPRSPAIPAEIRNSTSSNSNSPRVVARLMGLDDIPAPPSPLVVAESASEKRRKLLGALEKCDEDLKALKKIIEAVCVVQTPPLPPCKVAVVGDGSDGDGKGMREKWMEKEEEEVESEEPSPVSVLDYHHNRKYDRHEVLAGSPTFNVYSKRNRNGRMLHHQHKQQSKQQRQQMIKKKPGEEGYNANFHIMIKSSSLVFTNPPSLYIDQSKSRLMHKPLSTPWSTAMKESVGEVCRDVSRGQNREVVQIGLLIQDFIYKDLIEEIIKEMGCNCGRVYRFPRKLRLDACKRKLSF